MTLFEIALRLLAVAYGLASSVAAALVFAAVVADGLRRRRAARRPEAADPTERLVTCGTCGARMPPGNLPQERGGGDDEYTNVLG